MLRPTRSCPRPPPRRSPPATTSATRSSARGSSSPASPPGPTTRSSSPSRARPASRSCCFPSRRWNARRREAAGHVFPLTLSLSKGERSHNLPLILRGPQDERIEAPPNAGFSRRASIKKLLLSFSPRPRPPPPPRRVMYDNPAMTTAIEAHGACDSRFAAVRDAFAENFAARGEIGAAVAAVVDGDTVVDLWGGHADAARTRAWERDTIVNVYSATKGFVTACAHRLVDRGLL